MISLKPIFISFAMEDIAIRTLLVGQAKNNATPFEFIDMSVKEPWDNAWKTNCRIRIRQCSGFIALISRNTYNAEGARWEIKCAREENIPILGLFTKESQRGCALPPEMSGIQVVDWTWPNLEQFLRKLH